jgi:hypothetical protein
MVLEEFFGYWTTAEVALEPLLEATDSVVVPAIFERYDYWQIVAAGPYSEAVEQGVRVKLYWIVIQSQVFEIANRNFLLFLFFCW